MDTMGLMEPRAGVELWSTPNFSVALGAGYVLPFVSAFDAIRGPRVTLVASLAFW